jgi:hypothetical protein
MKSLLVNLSTKRAIGLQIGDRSIVVSQVVQTALGPVEVGRHSELLGDEPLANVLARALKPALAKQRWRKAPVAIGLPVIRSFFNTKPVNTMERDTTTQPVLQGLLQSSNLLMDDIDLDLVRSQPFKTPLATVLATRKKYLAPIQEALAESSIRPHQVEASALALFRLAVSRHRTPRNAKTAFRVCLGSREVLTILTALDRPLAWRFHDLAPGDEIATIGSTVTTLRAQCQAFGLETPPDLVILHGRPDLVQLEASPLWLKEGIKIRRHDGPSFADENAAFGLALGLFEEEQAFNLVRALRPQGSILSSIPWKQLVMQVGVFAAATSLLHVHVASLESQLGAVLKKQKAHSWIGAKTIPVLEKERVDLTNAATAVQQYLGTRVLWTAYTREVGELLPHAMTVSSINGQADYVEPGKKVPANSKLLTLKMETPISEGNTVPAEMDTLLDALRASSVLRRDFPTIKMSAFRWSVSQQSKTAMAAFSVTCIPDPKAVVDKPPVAKNAH